MASVFIWEGRLLKNIRKMIRRCATGADRRKLAPRAAVDHPGRRHGGPLTHWATGDVTLAEQQQHDGATRTGSNEVGS